MNLLCRIGWHKYRLFIRTIPVFAPGEVWADIAGLECRRGEGLDRCDHMSEVRELRRHGGFDSEEG